MTVRLNPKVSKRQQLCAAGRAQLGAVVVVVALVLSRVAARPVTRASVLLVQPLIALLLSITAHKKKSVYFCYKRVKVLLL